MKQVKVDKRLLKQIRTADEDIADMAKIILDEQDSIFEIIGNKKTEKNLKQSLIGFSIVRYVSLIEKILKMTFIKLIDHDKLKYNANFVMNLDYLNSLRESKKFTNGEILANKLNFQNFGNLSDDSENITINKIFSEVLGYDFLKKLKDETRLNGKHLKHIIELLEERHAIIHDGIVTKWNTDKLVLSQVSILVFIDSITKIVWLYGMTKKEILQLFDEKSPKNYEEIMQFSEKIKNSRKKG